jgi:methionyl-tRNA formyltransferase
VPFGGSNDDAVADWVLEREPAAICLFGCSIIRDQILEQLPQRVVNLHLGLSPYYRGAATNFWPLVRGEPECVGATIHLATLDVDAGPILRQVRPVLEVADDAHVAGCRTISEAANALVEVLPRYVAGDVTPVRQGAGGLVFRNRDFDAAAVQELWNRLEAGMIGDYVAEKSARDARFPIVE